MSSPNLPARPAYESLIESLKSQRRAVGRQLAGQLALHPKFVDALLEEHARQATSEAKRDAVPPAAVPSKDLAWWAGSLLTQCQQADVKGELPDCIDGSVMDKLAAALAEHSREPRNG